MLGLIFNFIGTAIVAFSIFPNPEGAYQDHRFFFWNIKLKLASINTYIFWFGLFVLCVGFLIQIAEKIAH